MGLNPRCEDSPTHGGVIDSGKVKAGLEMFEKGRGGVRVDDSEPLPTPASKSID